MNNFNLKELIEQGKLPDYEDVMQRAIYIVWVVAYKNNVDIRSIDIPTSIMLSDVEDYLNIVFDLIEKQTKQSLDDIHKEYRNLYINMKAELVLVEGKSDVGKSTVLKDLITKLQKDSDFEQIESFNLPQRTQQRMKRWEDEIAMFKNKSNGKTVVIFTMGDWEEDLAYIIEEAHKEDILVCSINTTHRKTKAMNKNLVSKNRFTKIKEEENTKGMYNTSFVKNIINRIKTLLK